MSPHLCVMDSKIYILAGHFPVKVLPRKEILRSNKFFHKLTVEVSAVFAILLKRQMLFSIYVYRFFVLAVGLCVQTLTVLLQG